MSREGSLHKRCRASGCGRTVRGAKCSKCGGRSFSWGYAIDVGPRGSREQVRKGGFARREDAARELTQIRGALATGTYSPARNLTLGQYLAEWLPARKSALRSGTFDSYELAIRRYIVPRIGKVPLQDLRATHIRQLYARLAEDGRERGGGLSEKSIHNCHVCLRKALADAVTDGLIVKNPAHAAHKLPERPEITSWAPAELSAFLSHVGGDDLFALWRLAASTGLRRGEILGLQWSDIDLDVRRISINRQVVKAEQSVKIAPPKTRASRRRIALDDRTVAALRAHRKNQLEAKLMFKGAYRDGDFVFCRPNGEPLHPDVVSDRFERHVRNANLKRIRLHDLRHTHASIALKTGVHPKVVQERLGHSKISTTLDLYSHLLPGVDAQAAADIAAIVDGPQS